jgi:PncC family amidohydrolase
VTHPLAGNLVAELTRRGQTLACAESLTGGLVAASVTEVPGASAVLLGGVVAYATEVKRTLLGVPAEILDGVGAVSSECATAMAAGVRRLLGADWAVSTTGVAGPDSQEGKPVGTVYVGVAGPDGVFAHRLDLPGDRAEIRQAATGAVLETLLRALFGAA